MPLLLTLLALTAGAGGVAAPAAARPDNPLAAAVRRAAADLAAQPPAARPYYRYLSYHYLPAAARDARRKVLNYHVNSLSRTEDLVAVVDLGEGLYRLSLADYDWDRAVWERMAAREPYFHQLLAVEKEEVVDTRGYHPGGAVDGAYYPPGEYTFRKRKKVKKVEQAAADHADPVAMAYLIAQTQSRAPIVLGGWFINQTAIQADRVAGYYDWLGLKTNKDFQKFIGGDERVSEKAGRDLRAVVARSAVTHQNRAISRYGAATGGWWYTKDFKASVGPSNTLRNLDKDLGPHDASEQYGVHKNGLFVYWLENGAEVRQDTAPDFIAGDVKATGTDRRIHIGMSCIRCHTEGLRPIDDWVRAVYRDTAKGRLELASPDYLKALRLRRLYLSDLDGWLRRDVQLYTDTLADPRLALGGWGPAEVARAYGEAWDEYQETDVSLGMLARYTGYPAEVIEATLRKAANPAGGIPPLDPVLAGLIADPPRRIRHDHLEEVFYLLMALLKGAKPL